MMTINNEENKNELSETGVAALGIGLLMGCVFFVVAPVVSIIIAVVDLANSKNDNKKHWPAVAALFFAIITLGLHIGIVSVLGSGEFTELPEHREYAGTTWEDFEKGKRSINQNRYLYYPYNSREYGMLFLCFEKKKDMGGDDLIAQAIDVSSDNIAEIRETEILGVPAVQYNVNGQEEGVAYIINSKDNFIVLGAVQKDNSKGKIDDLFKTFQKSIVVDKDSIVYTENVIQAERAEWAMAVYDYPSDDEIIEIDDLNSFYKKFGEADEKKWYKFTGTAYMVGEGTIFMHNELDSMLGMIDIELADKMATEKISKGESVTVVARGYTKAANFLMLNSGYILETGDSKYTVNRDEVIIVEDYVEFYKDYDDSANGRLVQITAPIENVDSSGFVIRKGLGSGLTSMISVYLDDNESTLKLNEGDTVTFYGECGIKIFNAVSISDAHLGEATGNTIKYKDSEYYQYLKSEAKADASEVNGNKEMTEESSKADDIDNEDENEKEAASSKPTVSKKEFIASCTPLNYKEVARNPEKYVGKNFSFVCCISSAREGGFFTGYQKYYISYAYDQKEVDDMVQSGWLDSSNDDSARFYGMDYDQCVWLLDNRNEKSSDYTKILEDDVVKVYGTFNGLQETTNSLTHENGEAVALDIKFVDLISE